jgi:hypothetical protein
LVERCELGDIPRPARHAAIRLHNESAGRLEQVLRRELKDRDPEFEAAEAAASQLVLNTVPTTVAGVIQHCE